MKNIKIVGLFVALGLIALGMTQNVQAQNALDNNLQVGSGGTNSPGVQDHRIDYRTRNDVVTGNVTGNDYFRGRVGYRSAQEFHGDTADDELFRFRARSANTSVPTMTSRSFGATYAPMPAYRGAPAMSGMQVANPMLSTRDLIAFRGGNTGLLYDAGTATLLPSQILSPGNYTASAFRDTSGYSLYRDNDGRMLQLEVSSLFGVRTRDARQTMQPNFQQQYRMDQSIEIDPALDAAEQQRQLLQPDQRLNQQQPTRDPLQRDPETDDDSDREEQDGEQTSRNATHRYQPMGMSPAPQIGMVMQDLEQKRTDRLKSLEQVVDRLERSLFEMPLAHAERRNVREGDDVYIDLVRRLQSASRGELYRPEGEADIDLQAPSDQQMERAERERLAAREARGLPAELDATEEDPAAAESEEDADSRQAMENFLDKLAADQPTLSSFQGRREDLMNSLLADAEAAMAAGRYFDAERRYNGVLKLNSGYPLARIGLVHSQLGAGLIRSAAFNLRNVFTAHPELIGTRYESNLLPNEERLKWARTELENMIDTTDRQEPALLLAYLGHQTRNRRLAEYGLILAETRDPSDPLLPLLRRIWLSEKGQNEGDSASNGENAGRQGQPQPPASPDAEK